MQKHDASSELSTAAVSKVKRFVIWFLLLHQYTFVNAVKYQDRSTLGFEYAAFSHASQCERTLRPQNIKHLV